jgi:flavin-binding protein dodecin
MARSLARRAAPPRDAAHEEAPTMADVARVTEISCRSEKSFDDAVRVGLERANRTLRNVKSAWIKDMRVQIDNNKVSEYQVNLQITFVLDN